MSKAMTEIDRERRRELVVGCSPVRAGTVKPIHSLRHPHKAPPLALHLGNYTVLPHPLLNANLPAGFGTRTYRTS